MKKWAVSAASTKEGVLNVLSPGVPSPSSGGSIHRTDRRVDPADLLGIKIRITSCQTQQDLHWPPH
jgi:hypothetical protein